MIGIHVRVTETTKINRGVKETLISRCGSRLYTKMVSKRHLYLDVDQGFTQKWCHKLGNVWSGTIM